MRSKLRNSASKIANSVLGLANLKLVYVNTPNADYRDYISLKQTLAGASAAGLSVGDYIDAKHNKPGATQETIDQMVSLGVFRGNIERISEIGPGSGRYLEKTIQTCNPKYYEIYETAREWEQWLVQKYEVTAHPADGRSLAHTPSASIDLVHAHKVLPGQPSLTICRYLSEMARVTCEGGKVVFDIVTEDCLKEDILAKWLVSAAGYQHYPCLMPKQFAIDFFKRRGFLFDGSFLIPMEPGFTEYLVFTRVSHQ